MAGEIKNSLEFEKPVIELERKINEMKEYALSTGVDLGDDIARLEKKADQLRQEIYSSMTRWQRVQLARHQDRPYTQDYIERICNYFEELHGDRYFADDKAIVGGLAMIDDISCVIIGHQKGGGYKK